MVGAGGVVAEGDRGPGADEHGPGVADLGGQLARVGDQQLQVLGGERLGHPQHGRPVVAEHDRGLAGEGGLDPVAVGGGRHLLGEQGLDRLPHVGVVGDQQAGGQRVVLGLGDQVDGDQQRVGGGVGEHGDLGRPGEPVGPDPPGHLPLGQGDIEAAGPGHRVDRRDGRGPAGQGGHRLGPAQQPHLVHTEQGRRPEDGGVAAAPGTGRGRQGDLGHPGRLGRDDVHDHTGGIGPEPSGGVHPGPAQRHEPLDQANPGPPRPDQVGRPLRQVEVPSPPDGVEQGGAQLRPQGRLGGGQLVRGDPPGGRRGVDPVEPAGRLGHGKVAAGRDVVDHAPHPRPGRLDRVRGGARQHPGRVTVGATKVDNRQHGQALHSTPNRLAGTGFTLPQPPGQCRSAAVDNPAHHFPRLGYAPPPGARARALVWQRACGVTAPRGTNCPVWPYHRGVRSAR